MNQNDPFNESDIVSKYTSDQAEEDGILVRVSQFGEPSINFFTRSVWESCLRHQQEHDCPSITSQIVEIKKEVIEQILKQGKKIQIVPTFKFLDWMYQIKVRGWNLWLCQNETGGYTLLFPEDY